jgi:regulator of protease activity HflC (stomatin/prohibitin superfamily)
MPPHRHPCPGRESIPAGLAKGQEILTADKVALRVSILVQFRVTDAKAAVQTVADYEERLYSDVQLAARRSLASMTLEEILTNRNRLSEDILAEVKEVAAGYGVAGLTPQQPGRKARPRAPSGGMAKLILPIRFRRHARRHTPR